MSLFGGGKANEFIFQNDMIRQLVANGWLLGSPENYNRELPLYAADLLVLSKRPGTVSGRNTANFTPTTRLE
jgi:type I restriction enzyme R subunit